MVTFAGLQKVILVEDGKAVERQVTTGDTQGDRVEILSGVREGEQVVVEPGSLQQGQPVRLEQPEPAGKARGRARVEPASSKS